MTTFKHVHNSRFISVLNIDKRYGLVKRGGKTFFRNYGRKLKNGKGLTFLDVTILRMKKAYESVDKGLKRNHNQEIDYVLHFFSSKKEPVIKYRKRSG